MVSQSDQPTRLLLLHDPCFPACSSPHPHDVACSPPPPQDDVPPFPDSVAFAIMEEQLGRPLEQVFSSISERPVAAASLGQVRANGCGCVCISKRGCLNIKEALLASFDDRRVAAASLGWVRGWDGMGGWEGGKVPTRLGPSACLE